MIRAKVVLGVLVVMGTIFSVEGKEKTTSLDERIAIKKLAQYWNERDEGQIQASLSEFVNKYPKSIYTDQLQAMLGELFFSKKNYAEAISAYEQVRKEEVKKEILFHYFHSLYETGQLQALIEEASPFLEDPASKQEEAELISFEVAEACRMLAKEAPEGAKKELEKRAIALYEALQRTALEEQTLEPLSSLYTSSGDYPKAVLTYLRRTEWDEKNQEKLLFHAACLQMHYDKKGALRTFNRLFVMKGPLAKRAAYNMIALLFQTKRYADVVATALYVGDSLPADKVGLVRYYTGRALLHEGNFEAAAEQLEEALTQEGVEDLKEKIILSLINCSKKTGDLALCDRMIKKLKERGADADTLRSASLIHANLCRAHKEWSVAREDVDTLLEEYPEYKEKETLLYDRALLLVNEGKKEEGVEAFAHFLKSYPTSKHRTDALNQILHLRIEVVNEREDKRNAREALLTTIEEILKEEQGFSPDEKKRLRLCLGQTHYHLFHLDQAVTTLKAYTAEFPEDPSSRDAYLILASCYQGKEDDQYVFYAEKALSLTPEEEQSPELHRCLFNCCLKLSEKGEGKEKQGWVKRAAEHLFHITDGSVSRSNLRWLASYYLDEGRDPTRAALVLEGILKPAGNELFLSLEVEAEAIKLALLYREGGRHKESLSLLEALVKEQEKAADLEWKYGRMAKFEEARAHHLLGEADVALDLYEELISSASHLPSFFSLAAQLEVIKLKVGKLDPASFSEQNPTLLLLCDQLKEIATRRQLYSEPLHVEAELLYAEIKGGLVEKTKGAQKAIALLEQIQKELKNFSEEELTQFPDKKELVEHYLCYIEIKLANLRGEKEEKIKERLHELLSHVYNETLKERLVNNLGQLELRL